jgi:carbon-monoxide dehydrogenase medium subunit
MQSAFRRTHWSHNIEITRYFLPRSLSEALDFLTEYKGKARVIAGGTDVIPALRKRDYEVQALVDITRIPGLNFIRQEEDKILLGCLVTHNRVSTSELIIKKAAMLADGARSVGSPQIRNIATVAGNLVSGQPAGDTTIPLLALDAEVTIASSEGNRVLPLTEFFLDLGKTALDPSKEILIQIAFKPLSTGQGGSYLRLSKRKTLTLPMLVCAVKVKVNRNKDTISEAAIALGPMGPTPFRAQNTEDALKGASINRTTIIEAAENTAAFCSPRDSFLRGSCDYRQEMAKVFVKRGLSQALEQAGHPIF